MGTEQVGETLDSESRRNTSELIFVDFQGKLKDN